MTVDRAAAGRAALAAIPNLRDIGGRLAGDGSRVRTGVLYRSSALDRPGEAGRRALARLGLRTVFDLRTEPERMRMPDRLPPGATYVVADVIVDADLGLPVDMFAIVDRPDLAMAHLGGGRARAMWIGQYRSFITLASARASYGRLFSDLAEPASRPALVHCTTGKDRTGWAVAALLLLLGVPEPAVMEDYLESGRRLRSLVEPLLEAFAARGGDRTLLEPIVATDAAYLEASLREVRRTYGTIERYFGDGLAIDRRGRAALREAFLEAR